VARCVQVSNNVSHGPGVRMSGGREAPRNNNNLVYRKCFADQATIPFTVNVNVAWAATLDVAKGVPSA
jgi:hypothetical protein